MTFYVTQSLDGTINHCISGKYKVILLHLEMQFSDHSEVVVIMYSRKWDAMKNSMHTLLKKIFALHVTKA